MDSTTLINQFKDHDGLYPKQAILEALQNKDAVIPGLNQLVQQTIHNRLDVIDRDDYRFCVYSIFLLAQFREASAYPVIVDLLSLPDGKALEIVGDMFIEDIARILASVANGHTEPLKRLIEDQTISVLIRASAIEAFLVMLREKEITRNVTVDYFKELFDTRLEKKPSVVWDCLVACCTDIHPIDLSAEIELAYEQELIDEDIVDQEKVNSVLNLSQEDVMNQFYQSSIYTFITDIITEMEAFTAIMEDESVIDYE